jgi:hypothetical protein
LCIIDLLWSGLEGIEVRGNFFSVLSSIDNDWEIEWFWKRHYRISYDGVW